MGSTPSIAAVNGTLIHGGISRTQRAGGSMTMAELRLFADYHQIHVSDDGPVSDLGSAWTDQAVADGLAADTNVIAIGTSVNVDVAVTVEMLESAPEDDSTEFDHVVEASLDVPSGRLVVIGCNDYKPDAARFKVALGPVRVRAARSNLDEAERLDVDSDDDPATMERAKGLYL